MLRCSIVDFFKTCSFDLPLLNVSALLLLTIIMHNTVELPLGIYVGHDSPFAAGSKSLTNQYRA